MLSEKLEDIAINIRSLGAKSDGTDSTQAFIKAREKSKYIFVPAGVYIIDSLVLQEVVLFGNGTLKWKGASSSFMLELKGHCVIKGLTFDGNASLQKPINLPAIKITNANRTSIKDNNFNNFHSKIIVSDVANSTNVQVLFNKFENCGTISGCDVITVRSSDWTITGNSFRNIGAGHCVRLGLYDYDLPTHSVKRIIISENYFRDTKHVGITCEIYSQNILITKNIFESLHQAIKCESSRDKVYDITISDNIIRNIASKTSLNLSATKIKFINNRCYNLAGGPFFGKHFDCSHNEFYSSGSKNGGVISVQEHSSNAIVANNLIIKPRYRGIVLASGTITGNRIINCPDQAIRFSRSSLVVNNYIDGAKEGIVLVSSVSNSVISNNILLNISDTKISFSENNSFQSVLIKDNVGAEVDDLTLR
ncbi:right-handed parallel beta-helix repeat-containing protein [Priestia aryabhattai]|uniref:right-handed parallel beta-helix repeat-containing protein n=1 Tax=Priestia aryabhattai TaxID=412384 RepID=UPI003D2B1B2A